MMRPNTAQKSTETAARRGPRVALGGMSIEASNFSPHRSGFDAFRFTTQDTLLSRYTFLTPASPAFDEELSQAATWIPLVHARSLPGGMVEPEVYDALKKDLLARIDKEGPSDGFFLDIHGAMTVEGREDAEADLAEAVRRALDEVSERTGAPRTLISASLDLHGNVSARLVAACDLITCYRMAPHEDEQETKARAMRNLLQRLAEGTGAPARAYVKIPVLLPGEKTSTRLEPARGIYAELPKVEALEGVVDAAIWVGYAWADEPRAYASVVVTGDDPELIASQAEKLAQKYWAARADFQFVAPAAPLSQCLDAALAPGAARPYLISDSGDNPTAGGSGDVTWTLNQLLADPRLREPGAPRVVVASIFDQQAVEEAFAQGVGQPVKLDAGARIDHLHAGPAQLDAVVQYLGEGDEVSGRVALVRVGSVEAIITERRKPYHTLADFALAGVDPKSADIIVVKIGYLEPELYELAEDWMLALTPGGVDQDLLRLGHNRIDRPMFPFDPTMPEPSLTAQVFPAIPVRG